MGWVDKDRNMDRRYELSVQLGLIGDVAVARHWSRIGAAGQTKEYWFANDAGRRPWPTTFCSRNRGGIPALATHTFIGCTVKLRLRPAGFLTFPVLKPH
jgi:hypothetical protein